VSFADFFAYHYRLLPALTLQVADQWPRVQFLLELFAALSLAYVLIGAVVSRTLPALWGRLNIFAQLIYTLCAFIIAINLTQLSTAIPAQPLFLLLGLLLMVAAMLVGGVVQWFKLDREVRRVTSFSGTVRGTAWLHLIINIYFFAPFLLFNFPIVDHRHQEIFLGTPVLLGGIYVLCVTGTLAIFYRLFRLAVDEQTLPAEQRAVFHSAVEAVCPGGAIPVRLVESGFFNALAVPRRKVIYVGRDLLKHFEGREFEAILAHEMGHLRDREHVPKLVVNFTLGAVMFLLYTIVSALRFPGWGAAAILLFVLSFYFLFSRNRRHRLEAEAFADRYVNELDPTLHPFLVSGLNTLHRLNAMDADYCKKYNAAHLDVDERVAAVSEGRPLKRKRRWAYSLSVFVLALAVSVALGEFYRRTFPSPGRLWNQQHDAFHDSLGSDDAAALAAIQRAREIALEEFGVDSQRSYTTLNDLALYYLTARDYATAQAYAGQALAVGETVYGLEGEELVRALLRLGRAHYYQNDYPRALQSFARAFAIEERHGQDAEERKVTADWLIATYQRSEAPQQAAEIYQRMLALPFNAALEESRQEHRDWLSDYTEFLALGNEKDQAARTSRQTLDYARSAFGERSDTYAKTLIGQALMPNRLYDLEAAVALIDEGANLKAQLYGRGSEAHNDALDDLATLLEERGAFERAYEIRTQLLDLEQQLYGLDSDALIYAYWSLGLVCESLARWEKAVECFERVAAIEARDNELSPDEKLETFEKLGASLKALGLAERYREVQRRMQELRAS